MLMVSNLYAINQLWYCYGIVIHYYAIIGFKLSEYSVEILLNVEFFNIIIANLFN